MDSSFISEAILALIIVLPVLFIIHTSKFPALPGPGLEEYLPGGTIFPIFTDQSLYSSVMKKLGEVYGDIFSLWLGPTHVIVTSVPQDVVQVMSAVEDFERPPEMKAVFNAVAPGGIFTMPLNPHRKLKKILRGSFNHSMLKGFHTHMTEAIEELCDSISIAIEEGKEGTSDVIDITEFMSITTFRVITNVAFGSIMNKKERYEFSEAMNKIMPEMMKDYIGYPVRQALTMFGTRNKLFEYKTKILDTTNKFVEKRLAETEEEKEARDPDMLDTILRLDDHPAETLRSIATEFGVGGSHTSNQMLAWCIYETCRNPKVMARIEREISDVLGDSRPVNQPITFDEIAKLPYMMKVWKETCRMHPMGPFLNRVTTKDLTLKGSGVQLPKGTNILAFYQRCHMDPKIWRDPEMFKPERWGSGTERKEGDRAPPGSFAPFGIGTFSCPGRFLADYEGPLILAEMHRRFKFNLACRSDEIRSCTAFVETAQFIDTKRNIAMGVPVRMERRI